MTYLDILWNIAMTGILLGFLAFLGVCGLYGLTLAYLRYQAFVQDIRYQNGLELGRNGPNSLIDQYR